jgi:chromosome segregation ATPase
MRYKAIKELKEYEFKNLELAIEKRIQAISTKNRKIESLTKRISKLRTQRNKLAPKNGKERSAKYRAVLTSIRAAKSDLEFCKNWVNQKSQALDAKKGKLATLAKVIESGRLSLCFGSSKLLTQRPGRHNADSSPFESIESWQMAWNDARQNQWWCVGATDKPCGNPEVQWLPETKQLRIRLTDKVAHALMATSNSPTYGQSNSPRQDG